MSALEDLPEDPIPFGVSAETGRLLDAIDELTLQSFSRGGEASNPEADHLQAKDNVGMAHFGVTGDLDPNNLEESGWAVMFSPSVDERMKDALQPLLDHRKTQVGDPRLFKVFEGSTGYYPGQATSAWLASRGTRLDVVNPLRGVPFYILLVGPPDEIPFEFQYGLDIFWAVGRLWFETADEFRRYAESVIAYETAKEVRTARQMAIFAPRHEFDQATQLFCKQVATPLVEGTEIAHPIGRKQKFALQSRIGDTATKGELNKIFLGQVPNGPPALLLTGSHGMAFKPEDALQADKQGALVCQDWGGYGSITADHWYAASDLPAAAKVQGMIHVLFACYGGGTPKFDDFNRAQRPPQPIATKPRISRLPQALLAHPEGGALAVLAHVERAWAYSFQSDRRGAQIEGFRDVFARVLLGHRLGVATDQFNSRWAALSTELADLLDDIANNVEVSPQKLANMWVARDDARNYIVFGDPAVRLRVEDMPPLE